MIRNTSYNMKNYFTKFVFISVQNIRTFDKSFYISNCSTRYISQKCYLYVMRYNLLIFNTKKYINTHLRINKC